MIVFDTETTGLIDNIALPVRQQPYIIEFCAIKLDDSTLEEVGMVNRLISVPVPIPEIVTQITKINDAMLDKQDRMRTVLPIIADFFRGEKTMVAHNCSYDRDMLAIELRRNGWETKFPWPTEHLCTVELTQFMKGHRLTLSALYQELFGEPFPEAHRAENDVRALCRVIRELRNRKVML